MAINYTALTPFPKFTLGKTMSQHEYGVALEQFKKEYHYLFTTTFGKDDDDTIRLLATRKIRFAGSQRRTTSIDEYATGLEAIGEAFWLLIQMSAIEDGAEFITRDRLITFVDRYRNERTFVQLDEHGTFFAIVA